MLTDTIAYVIGAFGCLMFGFGFAAPRSVEESWRGAVLIALALLLLK